MRSPSKTMNDIPYIDIREVDNISEVRTRLSDGWLCLEIYKKKSQVFGTTEFEEKPIYILGNPEGG
jgi:hypothetical protein